MPWIVILLFFISCKNQFSDLKMQPISSLPNAGTCSKQCFDDYRMLAGKQNDKDYLAFENFGFKGIGRCRGHAIVSQMMHELAIFRDDNKVCSSINMDDECLKKYLTQVRNIMQGKVEVIHGFKNLYDFSNHPVIQNLLKQYVRGYSHRFLAPKVKLEIRDDESYEQAVFNELLSRVKQKQRPYVGIRGVGVGDHAVLIHDHQYGEEGDLLCVHDSNIILHDESDNCHNYFYVQEGKIMYHRYQKGPTELFVFSLMQDENMRVAKYIQARYNSCQQQTFCQ